MTKTAWAKRTFIGKIELDRLKDGSLVILKAYRKYWKDGTSCLDIMKYLQTGKQKEKSFYPIQHIQISWTLAGPFLSLFEKVRKEP